MSEGDPSVGPQGNVEIVRSLFDWFAEMRATGETSGVEMQFRDYAQLWTLRDGKVVKMKFYEDRGEALTAAGVSAPEN
jgi:hypothetical protein